jgi:hypothetical protein
VPALNTMDPELVAANNEFLMHKQELGKRRTQMALAKVGREMERGREREREEEIFVNCVMRCCAVRCALCALCTAVCRVPCAACYC